MYAIDIMLLTLLLLLLYFLIFFSFFYIVSFFKGGDGILFIHFHTVEVGHTNKFTW